MLAYSIILALSSSIDSLGIGITYGIKNTFISGPGKIVLFAISFSVTTISIVVGNNINGFLPHYMTKYIGFFILFIMGVFICIKTLKKNSNQDFDLDLSNSIDWNEACVLGLTLSLDSFCIGLCGSIIGINYYIFPFIVSIFQLFFISIGIILGRKLHNVRNLPNSVWSYISGVLLIIIGILRLMF
ncbi:MAG: manganese efflux pump [Clostridia bacterium]|nr:manganese efflux pump [Clostridia bacterium]